MLLQIKNPSTVIQANKVLAFTSPRLGDNRRKVTNGFRDSHVSQTWLLAAQFLVIQADDRFLQQGRLEDRVNDRISLGVLALLPALPVTETDMVPSRL